MSELIWYNIIPEHFVGFDIPVITVDIKKSQLTDAVKSKLEELLTKAILEAIK